MTGANNDRVNALAKRFNDSQSDYKVNAVFKGSYPEAMAAAIAAYRAGNAPHLLQVFEVGTATMMSAKGAIKPVYQVMADAGEKFDPKSYIPAVAGLLHQSEGTDAVVPVQQLDDGVLVQQGRVREGGPRSQPRAADLARGRRGDGQAQGVRRIACPFTTGWQSWTQLESFSAWHNLPFADRRRTASPAPTPSSCSTARCRCATSRTCRTGSKKGYFVYGGRKNEPEAKFYSGECAMMTTSSAAYGTIKQNAKFKFAESTLPYYADVPGAPQNTIIGGASLWVMGGKSKDEYKGVAKFLTFLSQPDDPGRVLAGDGLPADHDGGVRAHQEVGLLREEPGHRRRRAADDRQDDQQLAWRARRQLRRRSATSIDEELEAVWAGKKTAKQALDDARASAATS